MPPRMLDSRLTLAQAATYFGLSKPTINMWYVNGHLQDVVLNDKGHRLYLLRELVEAEHNTRRSPNSSRSLKRRAAMQAA